VRVPFPFRSLEPTFFSGLLDDPLLLVRVRPAGRNLLFDCGQLHHLAKRVLTAIEAIFISHAHMDHWMGIDSIIRHRHASPSTIDIFGPPGLADKLEHKLAGYDWNLAEDYWGSLRVSEVSEGTIRHSLFAGPQAFARQNQGEETLADQIIYRTPYLQVRAASCEHRVPSLIFRVDEQPAFLIDPDKLERSGLVPGPWLGELKRCFFTQEKGTEIRLLKEGGDGPKEQVSKNPQELIRQLQRDQPPASIGYISDLGYTGRNREKILELMRGVDLICCECTFLGAEEHKARTSSHLCTGDVNELLQDLQPPFLLPMHLSKSYSHRIDELYSELQPPPGTTLLQLPRQRTPRPLLTGEISWQPLSDPQTD